MFNLKQLEQAAGIVHKTIQPTLQHNWPQLCKSTGSDVWVKHENHTPTTAFKVRGGVHLLDQISRSPNKPRGLISATRGNHGQSLAFAGSRVDMPVTIVVPENNSQGQSRAIQSLGAELIVFGKDFEAARLHSLELQQEYGYEPIAPFCRDLVLGVASYALEFLSAIKNMHTVYVPIGMGSGICGLIKTRDLLGLKTEIVGVVAEGAPTFSLSLRPGKLFLQKLLIRLPMALLPAPHYRQPLTSSWPVPAESLRLVMNRLKLRCCSIINQHIIWRKAREPHRWLL